MRKHESGKKKRRSRPPISVFIGYLLVVTLVATGVTFSGYVTRITSKDSARTAHFGELTVTETFGDEEDGRLIVTPGVSVARNVSVDFTVTEVSASVFVEVKPGDAWSQSGTVYTHSQNSEIRWEMAEGWIPLPNTSGVFYRQVDAGAVMGTVEIIKDGEISIPSTITKAELEAIATDAMSFTFKAWAVQTGENAEDTWKAVKEG